ncbi:hypothetical protein HanHA300_Chr13g0504721 [Helianthus annuus]|nr:hypothetical protein HanHA300_Chr13g0504721 [Helianthus annuus]KAJ0496129.1 hypothetical protein HanHA89_Chr13g0496201 [Helianthus annuus]KAJ0662190.1 hypothetical protein HanLR1_Chr13g0466681 [Helianthus annuus]
MRQIEMKIVADDFVTSIVFSFYSSQTCEHVFFSFYIYSTFSLFTYKWEWFVDMKTQVDMMTRTPSDRQIRAANK